MSRYHLLTQKIIRTNTAQEITCCNPTPGIIWQVAQKCWVVDWNQTNYFFLMQVIYQQKKGLSENVTQKDLKCLGLLHLLIFQKISSYENIIWIRVIKVFCLLTNDDYLWLSPAAPTLPRAAKTEKFSNRCCKNPTKDREKRSPLSYEKHRHK